MTQGPYLNRKRILVLEFFHLKSFKYSFGGIVNTNEKGERIESGAFAISFVKFKVVSVKIDIAQLVTCKI